MILKTSSKKKQVIRMLNHFLKRLLDIIFSILGIVICSPFLALLPILIKIESSGPALFKQSRIGKNGVLFKIFKFRSMVNNAEKKGTGLFNYANDDRVTKLGKTMRKYSLDELPQFFNILKGDMSFVGPRPPVHYELGEYDLLPPAYKRRFSVKPGLTSFAQIRGRNTLSWDEKVAHDNDYIDSFARWGIFLDIIIILITIKKVITFEGAYELEGNFEADMNIQKTKKPTP